MSMVEIVNRTVGAKGKSDTVRLQTAFPSSPAIAGYDNTKVADAMETLHNGIVGSGRSGLGAADTANPDFAGQSLDYDGINATTRPFVAADVPTGAAGLPWTAYSPNIVSPGPGSINPADMGNPPPGTPRSSGAGSQNLPGMTSPQVAGQEKGPGTPGNLVKGHSTTPPIT